jgi:RimJ/RimL family protein N-acetyltransferase
MRLTTSLDSCVLRSWAPTDRASLVRHADNRKVWRNLTDAFPHPYTDADAGRWIEFANAGGRDIHLAIAIDGEAVGGIGAIGGTGVDRQTGRFGYWLGEPCWGRGIATAAARALVRLLEDERRFARLEAPVFAWNPASMRVLEKAGFVREGVLRRSVTKDGELIDSVLYALLIGA